MDPSKSPIARLPIELRLDVYRYAFSSFPQTTVIGTSKSNDALIRRRTPEPALAQVNSTIRAECLPIFHATRDLTFKLQSRLGFDMALAWIAKSAETGSNVLKKLRCVTIMAGPDGYHHPQEVVIDLMEARIVSMQVQLASHPLGARQSPVFEEVTWRLRILREDRRQGKLDMADALAGIVMSFECLIETLHHGSSNLDDWS